MTVFTKLCRSFVNDCNKKEKNKQERCEEIALLEVLNNIEETLDATTIVLPYLSYPILRNITASFLDIETQNLLV